MHYIIVTGRSLLWVLTSLAALLLMLTALASPKWLMATPMDITVENQTFTYTPSLGIFTRCKVMRGEFVCSTIAANGLATSSDVFPTLWKIAMVFICFGLAVMCLTVASGLLSFCTQSIFKKSIFTITGAVQVFAGMFYILGIMLYPMAWSTIRVQNLCGNDASPFYPGECTLGMGILYATMATLLTFVSACLSVLAEKSTSSDEVQDQIYAGHTFICLR